MRTVSVRELRDRLADHLDAVQDGERLVVTRHGTPVAEIVRAAPPSPPPAIAAALQAGIATRAGDAEGLRRLLDEHPRGKPVDLVARLLDDRR